MLKTILKRILKIKEERKRLEMIIAEMEGKAHFAKELYEFKLKYFELGIVLNYLERWDELE